MAIETVYASTGTYAWGTYIFENRTSNVVIDGTDCKARIYNYASNVTINGGSGEIWNYGEDDGGTNVIINVSSGSGSIANYCSNSTINCSSPDKTTISNNSAENVVIISGAGDDKIDNSGSNVSIDGGAGNDFIVNYGSIVTISTGNGNNTVDNRGDLATNVLILGGSGNDIVKNQAASITIDGGAGNDKIYNGVAPQSGGGVRYYDANYYEGGFSNVVFKYSAGDGNHAIWGFRENSTLEVDGVELSDISSVQSANGQDIVVTIGEAQISLFGSGSSGANPLSQLNISKYKPPPTYETLTCDVEINVSDDIAPDTPAEVSDNFNGLQGFEIQIAEQQITETVTFTAAAPFEILQQTAGQFLDYKYNLRIESITQRGILYTCRCCTNLEEILYSQLEYSVPEVSRQQRTWHFVDNGKTVIKVYDEPERANASGHVEAIAGALGISYKNQFDDFVSTAEITGGSTYADTIREIFGWSARIPTLLINAFIRDDCLYVIQRGHEKHVIDISNARITQPVFTRELVRTYWGEKTYIDTEVRTVNCIVSTAEGLGGNYTDDLSTSSGDIGGPSPIQEPSVILRKEEDIFTPTGSIEKYYNYDENGLLVKTIEINKGKEADITSKTITVYEYDSLGRIFPLYAEDYYDGNPKDVYLRQETMTIYDKAGAIVETRTITYTPTGAGQASAVGKTSDGETFLNTVKDIPTTEVISPYALNKEFQAIQDADTDIQQQRKARQQERLIPGIVPFDTSFPIVGDDKLIEITNAIKNLNRRTKETVTVTIYDYEHLIDFNDRIVLYGAEYFLVSNTLITTPHVRDQQNLTLVRWY